MNIKYICKSEIVAKMLVDLAKEKNLESFGHEFRSDYCVFAYVPNLKEFFHLNRAGFVARESSLDNRIEKTVSLEEMVAALEAYNGNVEFTDGDKKVIVCRDGSVTYGCTTVSKEVVDKIISERAKLID